MAELADALKRLVAGEKTLVAGTVEAVNESEWTCDVAPEDPGAQLIRGVSLRLAVASEAAAGAFVVPAAKSEALVAMVDGRPKLLYAQKVDRIYLLTPAGFGITVDGPGGKVLLGNRGKATKQAARLGDACSCSSATVGDHGSHTHTVVINEGSAVIRLE
jgi:hypothetical protein